MPPFAAQALPIVSTMLKKCEKESRRWPDAESRVDARALFLLKMQSQHLQEAEQQASERKTLFTQAIPLIPSLFFVFVLLHLSFFWVLKKVLGY